MTSAGLLVATLLLCSLDALAQDHQATRSPLIDNFQVLSSNHRVSGETPNDIPVAKGARLDGDEICYTLRTYVVARDDNKSDSTHLVKSSSCQKAARYRLKTVEIPASSNR